jgi:hypothetical protein
MTVANNSAYFDMATITAVKVSYTGPSGQYYKTFYNRNYATSSVFLYDFD